MITRYATVFFCLLFAALATRAGADTRPDVKRLKETIKVRAEWAARFQESRRGPEQTERFSKTSKVGRTGALDLSNISGNVVVTGGSGDEVRIEAVKRVRARSDADAKDLLQVIQIEVVEAPNRVEVRTVYPRRMRNFSGSVDYTVSMPAGASATIKSISGDVRVTNVRGELRAESTSGNVVTTGAARLSLAKTVSGDVDVSDAAADGAVTVETVSGNLNVRGLKARSLDVSSTSGDILLANVTCERANVRGVSGNIEYNGPLARSGRYEMSSHSGDVRLAVSGTTGFELEATTFSGNVRSDFPLTLRAASDPDDRRRGRPGNRSIRGSFGDASAIVSLRSFSGDIVVAKR